MGKSRKKNNRRVQGGVVKMKLSILMPVYNEIKTIVDVIKLVRNINADKEIILVDDCSNDGTKELLKEKFGDGSDDIRVVYHQQNKGKGAAICTAIEHAKGEFIVVQDADMEYSPQDIERLLSLAESKNLDAVYGSRFLKSWKCTSFPHYLVNKTLTVLTNILFGGNLTDMETCYKLVKRDVMISLEIKAARFDFEPEITSKLLNRGIKIVEIPVSYRGRSYDEGKKIGWLDGVEAVFTLIKLKIKLSK